MIMLLGLWSSQEQEMSSIWEDQRQVFIIESEIQLTAQVVNNLQFTQAG